VRPNGEDTEGFTSDTIRGLIEDAIRDIVPPDPNSELQHIRSDQETAHTKVDSLTRLLLEQAREAKARRKFLTWAAGVLVTLGGGGFAGLELVAEQPKAVADVEATMIEHSDAVEVRVENVEADVGKLRKAAIDQQVQIVDGFRFISDKIDSAHPNAEHVAEPPSLIRGRRRNERNKAERDLFDDPPMD
jgi:hypothetical protein